MAYPTVSSPYGLKPVNLIGGQVFAGSTRNIPIASGYNTDIFNGDIVTLVAGGTVAKSAIEDESSPVAGLVGVFSVVLIPTQARSKRFLRNTGLPVL